MVTTRTPRSDAIAGRRRHHLMACSNFETGRARIGNPSSQRRRSSARAAADAYRRRGSFRRQVKAIVSRSRGRPGTSVLGGAGSRVRTRSSVSITDAAWNGARPVKRLYKVAPRANTSDRGPIAARSPAICSGSHERGGTAARRSDRSPSRAGIVARPGNAEVGDHRRDLIPRTVGRAVEQDVRGLDVEMQHPGVMDLVNGPRDRRHQPRRNACRQRAACAVRQAAAGDQVEDEVETAVLFTRLVEPDDVGMADPPDRTSLAQPALAILRADPSARAHDLDGHVAGQLRLPRLIDHPHSTSPELAFDHKAGDRGGVLQFRQWCGTASLSDGHMSGQPFHDFLTGGAGRDVRFDRPEMGVSRRFACEPVERFG